MAQDTETTGVKDQQQPTAADQIDAAEVSELQQRPSFYLKVREQAERFASTHVGQFFIERVDNALKLIENTTKWSLPQDKNSSGIELERPLPWAPFLFLIVLLRLVRIWLSLGALLIGNGPVTPKDMIYFIQTRRRKLRAIRSHGQRVLRQKPVTHKLSQWFGSTVCRPGMQRANSEQPSSPQCTEQSQQTKPTQSANKRPREDDCNMEMNLTVDELLNKYANENSDDDSDFVPNEEDVSDDSETESTSDSDAPSTEEISSGEVQEILDEHEATKSAVMKNGKGEHHVEKATEKENKQLTTTTSNGSNDNSNKEQPEVAQRVTVKPKEQQQPEQQKEESAMIAAMMNTRLYNNTAAAGSPTIFDYLSPRQVTINSVPAYSTPNSETDNVLSPTAELEQAVRLNISQVNARMEDVSCDTPTMSLPQPQPYQKPQQQQQRQYNHHQRYRGRNRR